MGAGKTEPHLAESIQGKPDTGMDSLDWYILLKILVEAVGGGKRFKIWVEKELKNRFQIYYSCWWRLLMIQSVSLDQRVMGLLKLNIFFSVTKKGISRFPKIWIGLWQETASSSIRESHEFQKWQTSVYQASDLGLAENSEETASLFNVYFHLR